MDSEDEPPTYRLLVCLLWGVIITVALTLAVFGFDAPGILLWQLGLLLWLIPAHIIGTPEEPFYEGTPIHILAVPVGILMGIPIYAVLAFLVWWLRQGIKKRKGSYSGSYSFKISVVYLKAAPNNALQPTANSGAFMRETCRQ